MTLNYFNEENNRQFRAMDHTHGAYLILIDTSASMAGEKILAVENAVNSFIDFLKDSDYAEYTGVCIISFSTETKIEQPFTCSCYLDKLKLEASGNASMWEALTLATDLLKQQKIRYKELCIS